LKLFKSFPQNKKWVIEEIKNKKINKYFYILKERDISSKDIYFLAEDSDVNNFDNKKLKNFNNFTKTVPAYRANLKIFLKDGGFSSFQSEYPFSMVGKKGTILSSISSIANKNADQNYILIRNIYEDPIEEKFNGYLVNIKTKKIEEKYELKTNFTNIVEIKNYSIKPEIFLVTDLYLGIPMYASIQGGFVSLEHTHPPHEYILSENKFIKVSELKKEINEIIA
tara:strand:+ start:54191 stop:54862 length:672 start_codon:yes stop_codon:yes gene_type:complete